MKNKLTKFAAILLGTMTLAVGVPAAAFADGNQSHTMTYIVYTTPDDYNSLANTAVAVDKFMDAETVTMPQTFEGYEISRLGLSNADGSAYVMDLQPGASVSVSSLIEQSGAAEDEYGWTIVNVYACLPEDYQDTEETPAVTPADQTQTAVSAPAAPSAPVDTRTAQQKEIDEAKANGTWGIEYTTCQKCGYHNWTRQGNVYVCDTCGNTTTTVVSEKGVKGYVGSGAIAAAAPSAAPETRYATAAQAQAAADKREAAYAAAVAAYQKQIVAQNAAYLAALAK